MRIEIEDRKADREIVLKKDDLPLTILYNEKRYILILTRNDKLILNKNEE
jgi:hypothetical protein